MSGKLEQFSVSGEEVSEQFGVVKVPFGAVRHGKVLSVRLGEGIVGAVWHGKVLSEQFGMARVL